MKTAALIIASIILSGCDAESAPRPSQQERENAAAERLSQTPKPRVYRYADGELRVLEVPVAGARGYVGQKECFIWRDLELKTSSISCTAPAPILPGE